MIRSVRPRIESTCSMERRRKKKWVRVMNDDEMVLIRGEDDGKQETTRTKGEENRNEALQPLGGIRIPKRRVDEWLGWVERGWIIAGSKTQNQSRWMG